MLDLIKSFNLEGLMVSANELKMSALTINTIVFIDQIGVILTILYLLKVRLDAVDKGASIVNGLDKPRLFFDWPRRKMKRGQPRNIGDDGVVDSRKRRISQQQRSLLKKFEIFFST